MMLRKCVSITKSYWHLFVWKRRVSMLDKRRLSRCEVYAASIHSSQNMCVKNISTWNAVFHQFKGNMRAAHTTNSEKCTMGWRHTEYITICKNSTTNRNQLYFCSTIGRYFFLNRWQFECIYCVVRWECRLPGYIEEIIAQHYKLGISRTSSCSCLQRRHFGGPIRTVWWQLLNDWINTRCFSQSGTGKGNYFSWIYMGWGCTYANRIYFRPLQCFSK